MRAFALALFAPTLKKLVQSSPSAEALNRLSPFLLQISRVCEQTTSTQVALAALKCVPSLLRLQLPSAAEALPSLRTYMLDALTCTHGQLLVQPALRGLTTLLSYADAMEVNELQLELVLSFIKQHLNDPPLAIGCIALLRAFMSRHLTSQLIYEYAVALLTISVC
jgi:hypothetical protein